MCDDAQALVIEPAFFTAMLCDTAFLCNNAEYEPTFVRQPLCLAEPQREYDSAQMGAQESRRHQPHSELDAAQIVAAMPTQRRRDRDGNWKDMLEAYFQSCLHLFWPLLHDAIDWSHAPVFLDKELPAVLPSKQRNRRYVDKLASVCLADGAEAYLLLHMEVQARWQKNFAERMFDYFVRLREMYPGKAIVQLAIVNQGSRKEDRLRYSYEPLGKHFLSLDYSVPMLNLEDWGGRQDELRSLAETNPFALIVLVELEAERNDTPQGKLARKLALVRQLCRFGYGAADFHRLFSFLDAVLALPESQEVMFARALDEMAHNGESYMAYMTSIERVAIGVGRLEGRAEGKAEGMRDVLVSLLEQRFGALPEAAHEHLRQAGVADLQRWVSRVFNAGSLDDVLTTR